MLEGELRSRLVARIKRGPRRETAAAAFTLDTDAGGIKPELACIRVQPNEDRIDVLYWRRVR